MSEAEVREFTTNSLFKVTEETEGLCCVDGRYATGQTKAVSLAGGAAGLLGAAMAAANELINISVSDEQILEAVLRVIDGKEKFAYHSDTHHGLEGCGHNARCMSRSEAYGLTTEQSAFIKQVLEGLQSRGIAPVELQGDHEEAAVIIVKLEDSAAHYSLHHQTEVQGKTTQAFIYTETLVADMLKRLAKEIAKEVSTPADNILKLLQEKEAWQRNITVKELALDKGKPVFEILIDSTGKVKEIKKIV